MNLFKFTQTIQRVQLWQWLGIFCLLLSASVVQAFPAETTRIDSSMKHKGLFPNLYHQSLKNTVTVEDIIFEPEFHHGFVPVDLPNQTLRAYPEALWFFSRVHHVGPKPQQYILNYESVNADRVEFYTFDRQTHELSLLNRAGSELPFSERQIQSRSFAVVVQFKADQELDLFVKVQDGAVIPTDLSLWLPSEFGSRQLEDQLGDGFILGLLIVMAMYNLMLFINMRESLYFLFSGFFFSFSLVIAVLNGTGFALLWPDYPEMNPAIFYVSAGACMLFLTALTHTIVSRQLPSAHRWLLWISLGSSAFLLFSPLYVPRSLQLDVLLVVVGQVMLANLVRAIGYGFSGLALSRTFDLAIFVSFISHLQHDADELQPSSALANSHGSKRISP